MFKDKNAVCKYLTFSFLAHKSIRAKTFETNNGLELFFVLDKFIIPSEIMSGIMVLYAYNTASDKESTKSLTKTQVKFNTYSLEPKRNFSYYTVLTITEMEKTNKKLVELWKDLGLDESSIAFANPINYMLGFLKSIELDPNLVALRGGRYKVLIDMMAEEINQL